METKGWVGDWKGILFESLLLTQGFGTFQALGLNHLKYGHGFDDFSAEAIVV